MIAQPAEGPFVAIDAITLAKSQVIHTWEAVARLNVTVAVEVAKDDGSLPEAVPENAYVVFEGVAVQTRFAVAKRLPAGETDVA
jgi:hypothetical protein